MGEPALSTSAVCARHSEAAAVAICSRCGSFVCEACRDPGGFCPTCGPIVAAERGFPPFGFANVLGKAFELFGARIGPLLIVSVVAAVPSGLIDFAAATTKVNALSRVYDVTLGLVVELVCFALLQQAADKRPVALGAAVKDGFGWFGRAFGARWRAGWWVLGYLLLLIVPGLIRAVEYAVITPAAIFERGDALERSRGLVKGHRWTVVGLNAAVFGVLVVLMVGYGMASMAIWGEEDTLASAILGALIGGVVYAFWAALTLSTYRCLVRSEQLATFGEPSRESP